MIRHSALALRLLLMIPLYFAFVSLALGLAGVVQAETGSREAIEDTVLTLRAISDHGVLTLSDGREFCLSGVSFVGSLTGKKGEDALPVILPASMADQPIRLDPHPPTVHDRYGCALARLETVSGMPLQRALIEQGLARVSLPSPSISSHGTDDVDAWLGLEEQARHAGLGHWGNRRFEVHRAENAAPQIGRNSLIQGRVLRVSENDRYAYLNFGRNWRTDFTVRLNRRLIKAERIDPDHFTGKVLRVRGFVQESRGPLIDVTNLQQIEVIP